MTTMTPRSRNWFAASRFAQALNSTLGRIARIAAGGALIAAGLLVVGGVPGLVLAAVGLVPLLAGSFDVCVFSALFGGPLRGAGVRECAR
jgi:hypothetical protein